ncbi:hypothetical protein HHK36_011043 [Tetracentron sinense]|uniref:Thaumatin-like protein n=1 Tax=Tetracentron sinense TaxID=13715 RepID=A0A834Z9J0_TETSI|nr:hypothetical protein HHK36_011043 [Tetracentron sinense]
MYFLCLGADGTQLILVNNCNESIWPGILGSAGYPSPKDGGFHLNLGEQLVMDVSEKWSGRIWGRQGCSFDQNGKGSCETGDCAGLLHCRGTGGVPPATVVEMTLGTSKSALHYYDVSLVDGFNLPVAMVPVGGGVGCGVAECEADVNVCCPSALELKRGGKVVGCKSACLAMKSARYCCTGDYANPKSCKPTVFAHLFKAICPGAYSYAYDDSSSLKSCRAPRVPNFTLPGAIIAGIVALLLTLACSNGMYRSTEQRSSQMRRLRGCLCSICDSRSGI